MDPVFSTNRLIVRRWMLTDAKAALRMYGDPRVWTHIGGRPGHVDIEETRGWLRRVIDAYDIDPDRGCWAIVERTSGRVIGAAFLVPFPDSDDSEIGYHLAHDDWGRGFATEVARGLISYGFDVLDLHRIVAVTSPDNQASRRVLANVGLTRQGTRNYHGTEKLFYVTAGRPSEVSNLD